ncbi:hypothetical protein IQ216_06215 [Cyanobium sp. LEGE 06143]|uniref:glycosyltransferase n=1 Tax=Cyanobium sp. LEGE 06143 TaxID=945727 RepID=UPI0018807DA4|nr:glycosyltransferase [Cyanobium sp. LEGE 06143]MBE9172696.1 hypothetical protein [Cyanobium sp. LEGE 06143]
MTLTIPVFVGYDMHERVAMNVLIDSLYQHSSVPLAITPIVMRQLHGVFHRERNQKQSTEFSFTRFLVPYMMDYKGWAIFMDCDMLCRGDIAELWGLCDDRYSLMCVQHVHEPTEKTKFLGSIQTRYEKKNWSSLMLFNCERCQALTPEYVNTATGLALHRFEWLESGQIGALPADRWNHLIDVQAAADAPVEQGGPALVHWTLGGPWFRQYRFGGGRLATEWFAARDEAFRLWE